MFPDTSRWCSASRWFLEAKGLRPFYGALFAICYDVATVLAICTFTDAGCFIRVPSRFAILRCSRCGGDGFERLVSRLRPAQTIAAAWRIAVGQYSGHPFAGVPFQVDIPAIDRWLDTQPKPFAIAEVPVPSPGNAGAFERQQTMAMLHSMAHWQRTVPGYIGIRPQLHWELLVSLTAFPDELSRNELTRQNVN